MSQTLLLCGPAAAGELDSITMTGSAFSKYLVRISLVLLILCAGLILLLRVPRLLTSRKVLSADDFVEYWSAGRLNLEGSNPYDPKDLLALEMQAGPRRHTPDMMWNPLWTLPLVMPFGALDYSSGRSAWFFCQMALLFFCAAFTWRFYGGRRDQRWVAWLITLSFPPTLSLLQKGQISAVMLTGIILLLAWTERRRWWLVALSMLFISVKPHILYLVPLAFLFWCVNERRWWLLAASATGIVSATCVAMLFNPMVVKQYFFAVSHYPPTQWATPTIGGTLRYFLGADQLWLQFLPTALGMAWFCVYWFQKRPAWNWAEQIPVLVMVSVLTSSYGWSWDYVVMIPAILYVAVGLYEQGMNRGVIFAAAFYFAIEATALRFDLRDHNDFYMMWLAPSLAVWYFSAVRLKSTGLLGPEQIETRERSEALRQGVSGVRHKN